MVQSRTWFWKQPLALAQLCLSILKAKPGPLLPSSLTLSGTAPSLFSRSTGQSDQVPDSVLEGRKVPSLQTQLQVPSKHIYKHVISSSSFAKGNEKTTELLGEAQNRGSALFFSFHHLHGLGGQQKVSPTHQGGKHNSHPAIPQLLHGFAPSSEKTNCAQFQQKTHSRSPWGL